MEGCILSIWVCNLAVIAEPPAKDTSINPTFEEHHKVL